MIGGQVLDAVIKLRAAIDRAGFVPDELLAKLVIRLAPREWDDFRHYCHINMWGFENADWTSCKLYGIRVEVDPDAA